MIKAEVKKHVLQFKIPGGTSRGILKTKESWFIILYDDDNPEVKGIGECSLIRGLSFDDRPDFEEVLTKVTSDISFYSTNEDPLLDEFPSIRFGIETALLDLQAKTSKILFPGEFTKGLKPVEINGLIWMGSPEFMRSQLEQKIGDGFRCIKMKIGAIDFKDELSLLKHIRKHYSKEQIEIRVDANGAFVPDEALEKLKQLSEFELHSIEQPIRPGQTEAMAELCEKSPVPVALDEELIGIFKREKKKDLLRSIRPQFIILKPGLVGGIVKSEEWIELAEAENINWWVTSALEANIGLNAIAQWTSTLKNPLPQGLGTGQLYTNNIPSPLRIENGHLWYSQQAAWDLSRIIK